MDNPIPKNPRPDEVQITLGQKPGADDTRFDPEALADTGKALYQTEKAGVVDILLDTDKPNPWVRYHTFSELDNAPPVTFLIDGFLEQDGVTAIAAPVGQRKTLIAMNVVHALLTGDALFGFFTVAKRPSRVLYLCPEMGIQSFAGRMRKLGLLAYAGKTLFCQTMSSDPTRLDDLTPEELDGAVVVLDTAIRFLEGDENKSDDMRRFAASVFRLIKEGAASVVLLHHSAKGTRESSELTLENAMRGSGELGAFVASCWATRLQNPDEPYQSNSYITNVKQRDFESKSFETKSDATGRMTIIGEPGNATLRVNGVGAPANRDGREQEALAFIQEHPELSNRKTVEGLRGLGIKRSKDWVGDKKAEVKGTGTRINGG